MFVASSGVWFDGGFWRSFGDFAGFGGFGENLDECDCGGCGRFGGCSFMLPLWIRIFTCGAESLSELLESSSSAEDILFF